MCTFKEFREVEMEDSEKSLNPPRNGNPSAMTSLWACCFTPVIFFISGASILMPVVGGIYWGDCPIENLIPLLLVIGGFITFIHICLEISNCRPWIQRDMWNGEYGDWGKTPTCITILCNVFRLATLGWIVFTAVTIYGVDDGNVRFDKTSGRVEEDEEYCHPILYHFGFWVVTLLMGVYAVLAILRCCCVLGSFLRGRRRAAPY